MSISYAVFCFTPSLDTYTLSLHDALPIFDKGVVAYATAKAGVIQLTRALALELAFKGIRVNAIAPGWIVTEMNRDYLATERGTAIKRDIPVGRFGEERDLDGPLLLLASDAGRFVTGATIVADGGQMIALRG